MVSGMQRSRVLLFGEHNCGVSSPSKIADVLGPSLLRAVTTDHEAPAVRDVVLAEPSEGIPGQAGDLVLGVGVSTATEAVRLVEQCAAAGVSGVVLRGAVATHDAVASAADRARVAVLAADDDMRWAHLVWLLRDVIDRPAVAEGGPAGVGPTGTFDDLFALADTVAAIIDAPVTFEDSRSRVLAYSSGQERTDSARVATIVGRRVPESIAAHFRSRGVFRRLANSDEPFLVPSGPNGTRPRLVVPVRAGGEWLGSIWAVIDEPVDAPMTSELRRAASILALHLLRLRAKTDIARQVTMERIRSALWQSTPDRAVVEVLPGGAPWRVAALHAPAHPDADEHLEVWNAVLRHHGWQRPVLADLDRWLFTIVAATDDTTRPGSWPWLRDLVSGIDRMTGDKWLAGAGTPSTFADLPRSRVEATELQELLLSGYVPGPAASAESAWDALVVHRAVGADGTAVAGDPVSTLLEHDMQHGTDYVATLDAWLDYHAEPSRAARTLVIHPNTLRYRLRRLQDLIDVDLDDPRQRLALKLRIESARRHGS